MRFIRFEIENFKGIEKTILDFSKIPSANIFTLVGLNESGKTTILEAIMLLPNWKLDRMLYLSKEKMISTCSRTSIE